GTGISGIAVQSDGRIVIAGINLLSVNGLARTNIARLNSDGSLDTSYSARMDNCGPPGTWPELVQQTDGKILVGGAFCSINGMGHTNLARLNPDGTVDDAFLAALPNLETRDGGLYSFCLQPDGKILASGGIYFSPDVPGKYVCRLNGDGSLD